MFSFNFYDCCHFDCFELSDQLFFRNLDYNLITFNRMVYPGTHVLVLVFSIVNSNSLLNIEQKWYPEKMKHIPDCPWILVGNKLDLRNDRLV